jgi:tetratricopeptide (TPR) repeat protein
LSLFKAPAATILWASSSRRPTIRIVRSFKGLFQFLFPGRSSSGRPGKVLEIPRAAPDYGRALERSAHNLLQRQAAVDRERMEAGALVTELLAWRPERQLPLLCKDPRFHTWGVLEQLLERSRDHVPAASRESERLAVLALAQSDHLDTVYYGPTRIADMRGRIWSALAEARRIHSDFAGSEAAFAAARLHLWRGTGDSLEWAVLFEAEAALRRRQQQFAEARELLLRALEIFSENGEDQRMGMGLVSLAAVHRDEGEPSLAIPLLHEALRRIDGEREPRLLLSARHELADSLAAAGRFMEARGILARARSLYRRFPDGWTQSHLRWLRGRIALGFDQTAEAEADLLGARSGFLALGSRCEAAMVLLGLAPLYARQERTAELKSLAIEAAGAFAGCGAVREVRAAMVFHRQAEEIEGAHRELTRAAGALGTFGD